MEAAQGDPLRAQEIEERLSETWFERWMAWRQASSEAMESAKREAEWQAKNLR
jgi:hypothetical protein